MTISATEASRLFNLSVALILFAVVAACGLSFRLKRELVINAAQRSASVDLSTGNPADHSVYGRIEKRPQVVVTVERRVQ